MERKIARLNAIWFWHNVARISCWRCEVGKTLTRNCALAENEIDALCGLKRLKGFNMSSLANSSKFNYNISLWCACYWHIMPAQSLCVRFHKWLNCPCKYLISNRYFPEVIRRRNQHALDYLATAWRFTPNDWLALKRKWRKCGQYVCFLCGLWSITCQNV